MTDVEIRRQRRALGGRAQDRLRRDGKKLEYRPHERIWGNAAARRRRQMAKRGLFGCAACGEPTPGTRLIVVGEGQLICLECAIAAGVPIPSPAESEPAAVDHDVHTWEGEGGAPPSEP